VFVRERSAGIVARPLLLRRAAAAGNLTLEAPSGYGKSTLASQLAGMLEVATAVVDLGGDGGDGGDAGPDELVGSLVAALNRSGLSDLAAAVAAVESPAVPAVLSGVAEEWGHEVLVVVDDVHRLGPDAAERLGELVDAVPQWRWVLSGWRVPDAARRAGPRWTQLTANDLQFRLVDVMDLVEAVAAASAGEPGAALGAGAAAARDVESLSRQLLDATGGWPLAVAIATRQVHDTGSVADAGLTAIVDGLVARLVPGDDLEMCRRVAAVPLVAPAVAEALDAAGAIDRIRALGLPIARRSDGWFVVPDAVRAALAPDGITAPAARRVAALYADSGEATTAVKLLHALGDSIGIAELVAGRPWEWLQAAGVAFARTILSFTTDVGPVERVPMLVQLARAVEHHDPRLARSVLDTAEAVGAPDDAVRQRVVAERAVATAHQRLIDDAVALATPVIEAATADTEASVRALYARGLAEALRAVPASIARARADLELAAARAELLGEYRWAADALTRLGFSVHYQSGEIDLAIGVTQRALALLGTEDRSRAVQLTYLAEILDVAGQMAAAQEACDEAYEIGRRLGDLRVIGYACWSAALIAAHRGDAERTTAWLDEGFRHHGPWLDDATGAGLHLAAAQLMTSLGDPAAAARRLADAEAAFGGLGLDQMTAPLVAGFEAAFGDPARALQLLDGLEAQPFAFGQHRWRRRLQRALAAYRSGDAAGAATALAAARDETERMGHPDLLHRHERWTMEQLAALPAAGVSAPLTGSIEVRLLGGFVVLVDGVDRTPTVGNPATLVKLLALKGSMETDEVIDALWPHVDLDTGRGRLRNTRSRIRSTSGDLVLRRGSTLRLAPEATVDVERFERGYAETFAADLPRRAGWARAAMAIWRGELLPEDRYAAWHDAPSARLRDRALDLLDLLAEDAEQRNDADEALRQLEAAIALDPYDDRRHARAGRLLVAQGRRSAARTMVAAALAASAELGVEPDPWVSSMAAELAR